MSAPLHILARERGVLRLFQLDMRPEQIRFLHEDGALRDILGAPTLDESKVHLVSVADLGELGLSGYLEEGCAVSEADLTPDQDMLRAVTGHVLALPSSAFGDQATTLGPSPQLRLLATYGEAQTDWSATTPLPSESARKTTPKMPPRANREASRRVGGIVFGIFAVLILVALVVILS